MVPDRTNDNPVSEAQFKPRVPAYVPGASGTMPHLPALPAEVWINGTVFRFDGSPIHVAAHHNSAPEAVEVVRRAFPMAPGRGTVRREERRSPRLPQLPLPVLGQQESTHW